MFNLKKANLVKINLKPCIICFFKGIGGRIPQSLNEIINIINRLLNICEKFIETNCPDKEFKDEIKKRIDPLLKSRIIKMNKTLMNKITLIFSCENL